jgi:hypothetical protein
MEKDIPKNEDDEQKVIHQQQIKQFYWEIAGKELPRV